MTNTSDFRHGVDDMMIDKDWILARLEDRFGAKAELADYMGVDRATISKILSGKRVLSQREALLVRKFFGEDFGIAAVGSSELPQDVSDVIKLIVSNYNASNVRISLSKEDARVVQTALSTFERLFSPERADDARLAARLRKEIEREDARIDG